MASGYKEPNFMKVLGGNISLRARNPDKKSRNKRREPRYHKLRKRIRKEEILSFPKPKNREERRRCSMI